VERLHDLNNALDSFWNDNIYGMGFTGMADVYASIISNEQKKCKTVLDKAKQALGDV
jgi:hypothetical protein